MIIGSGDQSLTAEFKIRNHILKAGVQEALGGKDEGPDPHELLQSALAACTIITVQMYAKRKQWDLKSIDCQVQIDTEDGKNTHLTRTIAFHGNLNEEQRDRLFEIAGKCPIHKLLLSKIEIQSQLLVAE